MSSIDERVVKATFDNTQFQKGVSTTLASVEQLNKGLQLNGSGRGLDSIGAGVDALVSKFRTLSIMGIAALTSITNKAVDAGLQLVKSLTIGPIGDGFNDYNAKLTSVQTVVNATGRDLKDVNKFFNILDGYADSTVFNLTDMTGALAKFVNAGVSLEDAIPAIQGIGNMTALAGQGANEASIAYYNLAQSLSQGFLSTTDFKSLQLANVATTEWKQHMLDAAVAAGTIKKSGKDMYTVLSDGSNKAFSGAALFTTELSRQWATAGVLKSVLKDYGDETTKVGKKAFAAAKDVKSLPMMLDTLKAAVGTGWTSTFEIILGDLNESKKLFTDLTNAIGGWLGGMSDARNAMLQTWKTAGGRTALIEGLKNVFQALFAIFKPIKEAFREIFPPTTGKQLADITKAFAEFTKKLKIGSEESAAIKSIFKGLFAIFDIAGTIIGQVVRYFTTLFGLFAGGTGNILGFAGSIGDLLVKLNEWIQKGQFIQKFFDMLIQARTSVLAPLITFVGKLVDAFTALVTGGWDAFVIKLKEAFSSLGPVVDAIVDKVQRVFDGISRGMDAVSGFLSGANNPLAGLFDSVGDDATGAADGIKRLGDALPSVTGMASSAAGVWQSLSDAFRNFDMSGVLDGLKTAFGFVKEKLMNFIDGLGVQDALAVVNTGFFIAFYTMMRKFFKNVNGLVDSVKGSFDSIGGVLDQVTDNLKTMQTSVRAEIILKIAGSLALLAAALYILAQIDPGKLAVAMGAVAIMIGQLVAALALLEKYTSFSGAIQLTILSVALVALSVALLALSAAVAIYGSMDWKTLLQGIGSIAVILGLLIGAVKAFEKTGGAKELMIAAAGLLILSVALDAFAGSIAIYSAMDLGTIANGVSKIVGTLVILALAMKTMPKDMVSGAFALLIVSASLIVLSGALKVFGSMSWEDLAKGLITIAIALPLLSAAVRSVSTSLAGAAALLVVAAALAMLAPVIVFLGTQDWTTLALGIGALAVALGVVIAAGYLAAPVVPVILLLGQGIALLGLAALAVGAGLLAFSIGLATLAASGAAGAAVLVGVVIAIAETFPLIMQQVALGIIAFAKVISTAGPVLVDALTTLILSMLEALRKAIPKFGQVMTQFILTMLQVINRVAPQIIQTLINLIVKLVQSLSNAIPKFVTAGMNLILGVLQGFRDKIPRIVTAVADLILAFLRALADNGLKIIKGASDTIIKFVNGLAAEIRKQGPALGRAGGNLLSAIVEGMVGGVGAFAGQLWNAAKRLASSFLDGIKSFLGIASPSKEMYDIGIWAVKGTINAVDDNKRNMEKSAEGLGSAAIDGMRKTISGLDKLIEGEIELNPTITPVLDLSEVQKGAGMVGGILTKTPVSVAATYSKAQDVQALRQALTEAGVEEISAAPVTEQTIFNQYNTSPKPINEAEVYRQTNNILSVVKGAVTPSA